MSASDRFTVTKANEESPIGETGRQDGYGAANIQYNHGESKGRLFKYSE